MHQCMLSLKDKLQKNRDKYHVIDKYTVFNKFSFRSTSSVTEYSMLEVWSNRIGLIHDGALTEVINQRL